MDWTEFDEQSETKEQALDLVRLKWEECLAGEEARAVVDAYEDAARKKGATGADLAAAFEKARDHERGMARLRARVDDERRQSYAT